MTLSVEVTNAKLVDIVSLALVGVNESINDRLVTAESRQLGNGKSLTTAFYSLATFRN